jgi:hypothetical protein
MMKVDKCDLCGQNYDSERGVSADLDKFRGGQLVSHLELCGTCYKIISDSVKQIKGGMLGQHQLL